MIIGKEEKEVLVEVLDNIINGDLSEINVGFGICGNLTYEVFVVRDGSWGDLGYVLVEEYSGSWEHFSGSSRHPIPAEEGSTPMETYSDLPKWEGNQLKLRQSLALHLKKKLTGEEL